VLKFEGFLKVYYESSDEDTDEETKGLLPPLTLNQKLKEQSITATERFSHHLPRYTEASLVKKLEELGIGRPSTYAPVISTIQQRGYATKEDRQGNERKYLAICLEKGNISEKVLKENTGAEKSKLFPSDIGMVVNDFLVDHFDEILDYNFTASVEKEFDEIAEGKKDWTKMLDKFYNPFHKNVGLALETKDVPKGERVLGADPETGKTIIVRMGKFGPMVQMGDSKSEEKPRYARLQTGQYMETITLAEALDLFKMPKALGVFEDSNVTVGIGRFGPYVQHKSKFYSLVKNVDDPYTIALDRAIVLINEKREKDKNKVIKAFEQDEKLQVLNGRWGAYIAYDGGNYKIPKTKEASSLTFDDCMTIVKNTSASPKKTKKKR
jgi:DNA topoisomerase I